MRRRELDRLLGRGRLSRPEKEAILAEALPRAPRRRARWLAWIAAPAVAAVATLVLVFGGPGRDPFRAKGAAMGAVVEASCGGPCTRDGTILFRVGSLREPAWLAAWAVAPSGERIWFFPSDGGEAPRLEPHDAPALVPRGVRLGDGHPAGRYRLVMLLVRHPPSRAAVDDLDGRSEVIARSEGLLEVGP